MEILYILHIYFTFNNTTKWQTKNFITREKKKKKKTAARAIHKLIEKDLQQ